METYLYTYEWQTAMKQTVQCLLEFSKSLSNSSK